jgi:hypothetical protein
MTSSQFLASTSRPMRDNKYLGDTNRITSQQAENNSTRNTDSTFTAITPRNWRCHATHASTENKALLLSMTSVASCGCQKRSDIAWMCMDDGDSEIHKASLSELAVHHFTTHVPTRAPPHHTSSDIPSSVANYALPLRDQCFKVVLMLKNDQIPVQVGYSG